MSNRDVEEPQGNKQDVNQKRMPENKGPGSPGSREPGLPEVSWQKHRKPPPSSFTTAFSLLLTRGAFSMSNEKPQLRTSPFTAIKHLWPPPRLSFGNGSA